MSNEATESGKFIATDSTLECHLCGRLIEKGEMYGEDLARACQDCDALIDPICTECGNTLDSEGNCPPCGQASAEFERMAYGEPTREERGYPAASDDIQRWEA